MAGGVRDVDKGYDALMADLADLAGSPLSVLVGVSGKTHSDMVVIAASNEFGTENGHIPERSYLRSTVDSGASEILGDLQDAVDAVLKGGDLDTELGRVGEKWVGKVKLKISSNIPPPNATVMVGGEPKVRKSVGYVDPGGAKTLIDTGRLRNSITWEIEREGIG